MEWWWISSASAWNRSFDRGTGIDYYEPRAGEYYATSWKRVDADGRVADGRQDHP